MGTDDIATILGFAAALCLGSALQSAAGFGFALLAVPMLVMLGCPAPEAIVLVAVSASAQAAVGITLLRRHARWPRIGMMIVLASLAVPVGVAALALIAEQDEGTVRRAFGGIVLAALVLHLAMRPKPRDRLPAGTFVGAMLASGFLGGFCGMSGPPAVLWVMAHKWSAAESRVTLWALFGGTMPVQLVLLHREFGPPIADAARLALVLVPASLVGVVPGLWLGHRIPKSRLRVVAMIMLAVMATYALVRG